MDFKDGQMHLTQGELTDGLLGSGLNGDTVAARFFRSKLDSLDVESDTVSISFSCPSPGIVDRITARITTGRNHRLIEADLENNAELHAQTEAENRELQRTRRRERLQSRTPEGWRRLFRVIRNDSESLDKDGQV